MKLPSLKVPVCFGNMMIELEVPSDVPSPFNFYEKISVYAWLLTFPFTILKRALFV
jgi:hypothetical protein